MSGRSGKLLLALATKVNLGSGPVGTHDDIFVLSRLLHVLKWGFFFDERKGPAGYVV
jgi:hypothetical protein